MVISGEEIKHLIEHPHDVQKDQLPEVASLIEKYPYCSSLYMLQMVGLGKSNDLNFESKLKFAASNVSDREKLHELLHTTTTAEKQEKDEKELEPVLDKEEEVKETEKREAETVEESEINEEVFTESGLEADIMTSVVESALQYNLEKEVEQKDEQQATSKNEESSKTDLNTVELKNDGREDIELEIEQELEEEALAKELEREKEKARKLQEKLALLIEAHENAEKEIDEEEEIIDVPESDKQINEEEQILVKPENMSFIEWLKYKQSLIEGGSVKNETSAASTKGKKKKKKDKKKAEKKAKKKAKAVKKAKNKTIEEVQSMSKKEINDLLDKFIEEEPTISSPSKDFFNPSTNAKKSLEDSVDIVSETLAKIHVMQGNYSQAIAAYQQLSLLYPEKKVFFASQIEKIKEKQNNS